MEDYLLVIRRRAGAPVDPDIAASLSRCGLSRAGHGHRYALFTTQGTPYSAHPTSEGVVVGDLFARGSNETAIEARGRNAFTTHWWGDYVAVAEDEGDAMVTVTVSPFGQRQLYHIDRDDALFLASSPDLLARLGLLTPRIDWQAFGAFLTRPDFRDAHSCLDGVSRVPPGASLHCARAAAWVGPAWHPRDHVGDTGSEIGNAARALERIIDDCHAAWLSSHRAPLVEISGGLDSSIIAASLARAKAAITGVTIVPDTVDGDELAHATVLASHLGVPLEAIRVDASMITLEARTAPLTAQPGPHLVAAHFDTLLVDAADRLGTDGFFNGGGGDNLFCRVASAAPVADRLLSGGRPGDVWTTLRDVTRLNGSNYWQVARNAAARWHARRADLWPCDSLFVAAPVAAAARAIPLHPWLDDLPPLPGKRRHVRAVAVAQSYVEGITRGRHNPFRFSLLSQPIVEHCLSIPTWQWVARGTDRAVARAAFGTRLAPELIDRQSKGTLDGLFSQIVRTRRTELRELLLDGLIVGQGLLDAEAIEQATAQVMFDTPTEHYRLIELAGYELWARQVETSAGRLLASSP